MTVLGDSAEPQVKRSGEERRGWLLDAPTDDCRQAGQEWRRLNKSAKPAAGSAGSEWQSRAEQSRAGLSLSCSHSAFPPDFALAAAWRGGEAEARQPDSHSPSPTRLFRIGSERWPDTFNHLLGSTLLSSAQLSSCPSSLASSTPTLNRRVAPSQPASHSLQARHARHSRSASSRCSHPLRDGRPQAAVDQDGQCASPGR